MASFDVNQLQQWINMLGHMPTSGSPLPSFQPSILVPSSLNPMDPTAAKSPDGLEYRASSSFQGTGVDPTLPSC